MWPAGRSRWLCPLPSLPHPETPLIYTSCVEKSASDKPALWQTTIRNRGQQGNQTSEKLPRSSKELAKSGLFWKGSHSSGILNPSLSGLRNQEKGPGPIKIAEE